MFNLSGISNRSLIGKAVRLPLRLIPADLNVRVLQGPLKGKRWVAGSTNHGCWLGSYEFHKQREIASAVRPGMVCFDIGANVGFYTLLLSALAGPQGSIFAFEPAPRNCVFLRRHLAMNSCSNVSVREMALADFDGFASFDPDLGVSEGHLSESGSLRIKCACIDTLIANGEIAPPGLIKMDVEGAEAKVLQGGSETIARYKPAIFLATHGEQPHAECCRFLKSLGYRLASIDGAALENCDEIRAQAE